MGKVMRHTLGASLNIRHNLSSSKGPKPLQLKLLTTYIPKSSAFTLAFSTSQRLRTTRASARTFFTFRHYITPSFLNFGPTSSAIYTLSLHDALPISSSPCCPSRPAACCSCPFLARGKDMRDRKSTRLNSSHQIISYAVFCLKKKRRPGRAPERFLPLDITSLLLHVIFDARFLLRQ